MLMHCSCIQTFSFQYSSTLCDGVSLSLSLSLSFSLSLTHGLRMAPKRKFAPSQNPLRSKASSSDPTPLHIQFRDELAARTSQRTTPNVAFIRNAT